MQCNVFQPHEHDNEYHCHDQAFNKSNILRSISFALSYFWEGCERNRSNAFLCYFRYLLFQNVQLMDMTFNFFHNIFFLLRLPTVINCINCFATGYFFAERTKASSILISYHSKAVRQAYVYFQSPSSSFMILSKRAEGSASLAGSTGCLDRL